MLLVEPNNHHPPREDYTFFERDVRNLIEHGYMNRIAAGLRVPLLMPTFPLRPTPINMQNLALDRRTLMTTEGALARVDLQLKAMIEDGQARLRDAGVHVGDKVLMHGFSRSGMFTTAFSILHPEIVQALAVGHLGWPTPAAEWRGVRLTYPIGIADVKEITGQAVDLEAYRGVHKFLYIGGEDRFPASYTLGIYYDLNEQMLLYTLFGKCQLEEWAEVQRIFAEKGFPAQFVVYDGVEHVILREMLEDVIRFLERNMEAEELIEIVPHRYD